MRSKLTVVLAGAVAMIGVASGAHAFTKLSFTVSPGTTSCGAAGLTTGASAPASGQLFSDTGCTTQVATGQLGLGCLYFGGGNATNVPGGGIPDGSTSILNVSGSNLTGASTGNPNTCTVGAGPGMHCANNNTQAVCANDAGCGGAAGACALDANCFFGPPLPVLSPPPNGALTTCVLNVVQTNASGTVNTGTGASSITMPLSSRVYITGNTTSPCPKCVGGSPTCTYGKNAGSACTPVGTKQTSNDCSPNLAGFQAPLAVTLSPLTTGSASKTDAGGVFCPSQSNAGAFGQGTTKCISETGAPPAGGSGASKCTASKMKATGKKASCRLGVYAKAAGTGNPVDTLKLQGCTDKFGPAIDKAETKPPCLTTGDKNSLETQTDTFTSGENSSIALSPPSKCQSSLLKAEGKKVKCKLGVLAKGVGKGIPADSVKLQGCTDKFTAAAAKAATAGDCGGAPSGGSVETSADNYVSQMDNALVPSFASGAPANSHLASVFCIPATGAFAVDLVADLPGPGAFSLNGNAQLLP